MNIIITAPSLMQSALNLDNMRVKKQALWLSQIVSNILHITDDYYDVLLDLKNRQYRNDFHRDFKYLLLPEAHSNHSATAWSMKTPLHTLFVLEYLSKCTYIINQRGYPLSRPILDLYKVSSLLREYLMGVLPTRELSALIGLDADLYRNTPKVFDKEKDTIISYQKYLTSQWKSDILKYEKFQEEKLVYSKLSLTKRVEIPPPRLVRKLLWRKSITAPDFADIELKEFNNARRTA